MNVDLGRNINVDLDGVYLKEFSAPYTPPMAEYTSLGTKAPRALRAALPYRLAENSLRRGFVALGAGALACSIYGEILIKFF